ncbi:uncharacterized protein ASPGLDRAFT_81884 [Aspergillus glaucus CBS 516.65]|uniref:Uncharacterized protein n=1 Tax=Aspergillus glaucus CBS 516.65 TaxID=1160497 RepID=A0A1L9VL54_ASPGL|nr:hypothetical protein ASPGLDRAFT_81884 [Aspergillus glaucus CBS 516.65]OJJ84612.1 hypothetical protein ASPGLDRAFT_81884 [Aspergillus glaucus CBS 516.65]
MSEEWKPSDQYEAKSKEAFEKALVESPNSVVKERPDQSTNRFILQTDGFHDLQRYVMSGMQFPETKDDFERNLPESYFKSLNDIDSGIFTFTRDSIVSISANCNDFNNNGLGKLVTSANGVIAYATEAMGMLKLEPETNFKAQVAVLLDPKYKDGPKDQAFDEAREGAKMALEQLRDTARDKKEDAEAMVTLLTAFHNKTVLDENNAKLLKQEYFDGPVINVKTKQEIKNQKPYSEFLNAEMTRLLKSINESVTKRDDAYSKWDTAKDGAIISIPLGILGWIAGGILTDIAMKAKAQYDKLVIQIAADRAEEAVTVKLMEYINTIIFQMKDLLPMMTRALAAMKELQALFNSQELNFQYIIQDLDGIEKGVEASALKWRKSWIERNIDKAVAKYQEIKETAEEFQRSAVAKKG